MKKNFYIKRTVALIVVLVMLVAMIPAGMISVGAAPTISLDDYDTTDEYVIMNIEDWKLIASATDKDFMGITVKLGADIDAAGETEIIDPKHMGMVEIPEEELGSGQNPGDKYPMTPRPDGTPMSSDARHQALAATFPTLFKNFAGTFDGQGHTIKNAKVEEALIAANVTEDGAEIKNVVIEGVTACDWYDYMHYGIVVGYAKGSVTIDNVTIKDSNVEPNILGAFHFASGGALVGSAIAPANITNATLTIKNCHVEAIVNVGEYLGPMYTYGTGLLVGTVDNFDLEMTDVYATGSTQSISWYAGAIGALYMAAEKSAVIQNVEIDNYTMEISRGATTDGIIGYGLLMGLYGPYGDNSSLVIDKVTVSGSLYDKKAGAAGGLIGTIQPAMIGNANRYGKETVEGGSISITNVYTDVDVTYEGTGLPGSVGGLGSAAFIGQIGEGNNAGNNVSRVFAGTIDISNCYVGGSVIVFYTGTETVNGETVSVTKYDAACVGGLMVCYTLAECTLNISNVVIDVEFPYNSLSKVLTDGETNQDAKTVGLIAYGAHVRQPATGEYQNTVGGFLTNYMYVTNVVTTLSGEAGEDYYLICKLNRKTGPHYNDKYIGNGDKAAAELFGDDSVMSVRPSVAKAMVKYDENGFITSIAGALSAGTPQTAAAASNKYAIRFVALSQAEEIGTAAGIKIVVLDATGNPVKTFDTQEATLLDKLTAANGVDAIMAEDFGAAKFLAVTIKNIPTGAAYTFKVTPHFTTESGAVVEGETVTINYDATGKLVA